MSTCARCGGELGRARWWIDGNEYHHHCVRSPEELREQQRQAEASLVQLMWQHPQIAADQIASLAHSIEERTKLRARRA